MRLLVYGINYSPEPTGIGRYTAGMARWMAERGDDVVVITAPPHYPAWRAGTSAIGNRFRGDQVDGVTVLRAPVWLPDDGGSASARIALETSFGITSARWWLPRLTGQPFDAILSVSPPTQMAIWPLLHHLVKGTPWFLHVQDLQFDAALRLGVVKLPEPVAKALYGVEAALLKHASHVSTISEGMRRHIVEKGVDKLRTSVVPNWADLEHTTPRLPDPAMRANLGAGPEDVLVVYSGNLGEKQGLEIVIEAAARLSAQKHVHFAVIGDGVALETLQQYAARLGTRNVRFHSLVPQAELASMLAAADIHLVVQRSAVADLVLPSKLANIAAAGRPSVVTAERGTDLHHITSTHRLGLICPPEDTVALAEAVHQLAESPHLRRELGANARSYAEHHLAIDAALGPLRARMLAPSTSSQPAECS